MKTVKFFTGVITMFLLVSCVTELTGLKRIVGKGPVMNEERILSSFNKVQSTIGAEINIIESDSFYVTISAQENVLNYLKTNVVNDVLKIGFDGYSVQTPQKIVLNVHMPEIMKFSLSGAAQIESDLPIPEIVISGSGDVVCKGKTESLNITINGRSTMDLYEMEVNNARVTISGTGTVRVNAVENLDVVISGVGYVYYLGAPNVQKTISGIGEVKVKN
jgi:hypothetical protein